MKSLFFAALLLLTGSAHAADCWVIFCVKTGDVGIGSTTGGVNTLGRSVTGRKSRLVYLMNPATGKGATFRIFLGGKASTKTAWPQFVAAERAQ